MPNLIPMEYKNQRIITTKVLAEQFGTEEKNITMNFSRNNERFIEGKHYYKLEGSELADFKRVVTNSGDPSIRFASVLILWTERGAARHAKILDTDEAWEVYETLEETYFKIKESKQTISALSPELQMFNHLFKALATNELEVKRAQKMALEAKTGLDEAKAVLVNIKETIITQPDSWRKDLNKMFNTIVNAIGENKFRELRSESYELLEKRAGVNLNTRLKNYKERLRESGASKTTIDKSNRLDVIEQSKNLKEIYSQIIKEYTIKYVA